MPEETTRHSIWTRLAFALFVLHAGLVALTFRDYGLTYDEEWRLTYGEYIVQWYANGFSVGEAAEHALNYWTLPNEAGLFGVLSRLASRVSPGAPYETSHLVNALVGLLGVVGAWRLGRLTGGDRAGFLAALFLFLTPRFYGHAFANPIDVPMATFTIWAVYYLTHWVRELPKPRLSITIRLGVAVGFALGVRIGALMLFGYVAVAACAWAIERIKARALSVRDVLRVVLTGAASGVTAWLAMLPWWPKAIVHPTHPYWAFQAAREFSQKIQVFYAGETISNQDVPRTYIVNWMWISLPELYLVAFVLGIALVIRCIARRTAFERRTFLDAAVLFAAIAVPLGYTLLTRPTDYDGMRHFLFVVPPLAVVAAWLTSAFFSAFESRAVRLGALALLSAGMIAPAVDMVRLHPYQSIYFNRLIAGGLEEASKSYETDYWGVSFKEGTEWVAENVRSPIFGIRTKIGSAYWPRLVTYWLPSDRYEYVGSVDHPEDGDSHPEIYLAPTRWNRHEKFPGVVLHTVERLGVPLLYIKRVATEAGDRPDGR